MVSIRRNITEKLNDELYTEKHTEICYLLETPLWNRVSNMTWHVVYNITHPIRNLVLDNGDYKLKWYQ